MVRSWNLSFCEPENHLDPIPKHRASVRPEQFSDPGFVVLIKKTIVNDILRYRDRDFKIRCRIGTRVKVLQKFVMKTAMYSRGYDSWIWMLVALL